MNEISAQLEELGKAGSEAADERYELQYRDYLSQRFYRVEAGTVRMTTNVAVDLRELFVMPNVVERIPSKSEMPDGPIELMPLSRAREVLDHGERENKEAKGIPILQQVRQRRRNVIVGSPGGGKSTFLEWFQLKVASAEEEFVLAGQQAIPLLLRVRQLDPNELPIESAMIERATGSRDFASLTPGGWLDRQMSNGRVVFMLDGLDEVDPEICDKRILPWFRRVCRRYPKCAFIVSSRPVGYPAGIFRRIEFSECDLLDFTEGQTAEYARHWCTAIRLARNETSSEAKREGAKDGDQIIAGFEGHPYIRSLARNPLMLSAICLVNYFEGGKLPKDRAVLYRLCVEGLLHNWDKRRGISSEFSFDEKLRVTREVALQMQLRDRAEYDAEAVQEVFLSVLKDPERASSLLQHVRYRTGLLLERRPGVFAFAHLTFQEYLAARAVHEGNQAGISIEQLIREHRDARWREVIALYCGLAPAPAARSVIEALINQPDVRAGLLADAYLSAGPELGQESKFRQKVMAAVAKAESDWPDDQSIRFSDQEFAPIANEALGQGARLGSYALSWLATHETLIDFHSMVERFRDAASLDPDGAGSVNILIHLSGNDGILAEVAEHPASYRLPGPQNYATLAEQALVGLTHNPTATGPGAEAAYTQALTAVLRSRLMGLTWLEVSAPPRNMLFREKLRPLFERLSQRARLELTKAELDEETSNRILTWLASVNELHAGESAGERDPVAGVRKKRS